MRLGFRSYQAQFGANNIATVHHSEKNIYVTCLLKFYVPQGYLKRFIYNLTIYNGFAKMKNSAP